MKSEHLQLFKGATMKLALLMSLLLLTSCVSQVVKEDQRDQSFKKSKNDLNR